ncbi:hypothetical protein [Streptomyces sp. NPDC096324]|uniref:hypothetical protein n=1 Tax=Streptomyces sp. NPDC096324 TaxID=3366085 RepID=UPI00380114D2
MPGSSQGLYLIVTDIEAARDELVGRGIDVSEIFHDARGLSPVNGAIQEASDAVITPATPKIISPATGSSSTASVPPIECGHG